jgi:hypothetical protein
MSLLVICFYNTDYIQGFVDLLGATNPFMFVVLFVGINSTFSILTSLGLSCLSFSLFFIISFSII